jgi:hypothetical protein
MRSVKSLSSLSSPSGAQPANMHFVMETISLLMTDLEDIELTLLINLRPFHVLPPSFLVVKCPNCG